MPTQSFTTHIDDLAAVAFTVGAAAATPGAATRTWAIPSAYPVGTPLYNPNGFITACYRGDLNELVVEAYVAGTGPNDGRVGQVVAGKMALDHIACRERALHARHATPTRLRAWASARRAGHSDSVNGVFGALAAAVADVYASATAVPNSQT